MVTHITAYYKHIVEYSDHFVRYSSGCTESLLSRRKAVEQLCIMSYKVMVHVILSYSDPLALWSEASMQTHGNRPTVTAATLWEWLHGGESPPNILVSRGQPLFRTEGKGLGFGHRATCRPAQWSAYQSQHSIQSHDTWSMWLTGKFKISVWIESEPEAWKVRTEREVSWDVSWNTAESKLRMQKGRKSYFAIVCTIAMWRHGWIYMTN